MGNIILGVLGEYKGDEGKKQMMLVHMDEKWFWTVVKRRHNKNIASLGIQPVAHKTHHTSHIHKVLEIATSRFLPVDNDIEKGGRTVKVRMDRRGRMVAIRKIVIRGSRG